MKDADEWREGLRMASPPNPEALAHFESPLGGISGLVEMERVEEWSGAGPGLSTAFEGLLEIPALIGEGTWKLTTLRVEDRSSNVAQWGVRDLETLGFVVEVLAVAVGGAE